MSSFKLVANLVNCSHTYAKSGIIFLNTDYLKYFRTIDLYI